MYQLVQSLKSINNFFVRHIFAKNQCNMKIFIPSDLTDNSVEVLEKWLPFMDKPDTEIYLINIIEPSSGAVMIDIAKILRSEAILKFDGLTAKLKLSNARMNILVEEGYFERKMAELVMTYRPDMVLLPSKAKEGIDKYLIGQKAQKFIGKIKCPILIVPSAFDAIEFKNIGLAVDREDMPTEENMQQLGLIEYYFKSKLLPFHIQTNMDEDLQVYSDFSEGNDNQNVKVCKAVSVSHGITHFVDHEKIDLLAMVTHKRNIFERFVIESNSRRMVSANNLAVLIFNN